MLFLAACTPKQPPSTRVIIDNCLVGCPLGGSNQTLTREAYSLNNNGNTYFANWVAYKITKTSQASNRPRNWKQDPALPATDTLAPAAWTGANAALAIDRGHQAPLVALGGTVDWESLNYLSNITPQKSALNQGAWARLEDKERQLANREDISAVYTVTGPLFERDLGGLPAMPNARLPSGYWKVIFIGAGPDSGKYSAFIMDQNLPRSANFCDYQVTVDSIERKTNYFLRIWPALPTEISRRIKSQPGTLAKDEMGCR
ncbi:DNA/RNA non-specific endonuclease [Winslowiella iniecta]